MNTSPSRSSSCTRRGAYPGTAGLAALGLLAASMWVLHSAEEVRPANAAALPPIGSILAFGGPASAVPESDGWMMCDGRELSIAQHAQLHRVLGSAWGTSGRGETFRLPDLRGRFLRGVNYQATGDLRDPDRDIRGSSPEGANSGNEVGSVQTDAVGAHQHPLNGLADATGQGTGAEWVRFNAMKVPDDTAPVITSRWAVQPSEGTETRPANVYVNWIIRVR